MGFLEFIGVVVLVFGVLQIILFFKIWGMTNDVATIVSILKKETRKESPKDSADSSAKISFDEFLDWAIKKNPDFKNASPFDQQRAYQEYLSN